MLYLVLKVLLSSIIKFTIASDPCDVRFLSYPMASNNEDTLKVLSCHTAGISTDPPNDIKAVDLRHRSIIHNSLQHRFESEALPLFVHNISVMSNIPTECSLERFEQFGCRSEEGDKLLIRAVKETLTPKNQNSQSCFSDEIVSAAALVLNPEFKLDNRESINFCHDFFNTAEKLYCSIPDTSLFPPEKREHFHNIFFPDLKNELLIERLQLECSNEINTNNQDKDSLANYDLKTMLNNSRILSFLEPSQSSYPVVYRGILNDVNQFCDLFSCSDIYEIQHITGEECTPLETPRTEDELFQILQCEDENAPHDFCQDELISGLYDAYRDLKDSSLGKIKDFEKIVTKEHRHELKSLDHGERLSFLEKNYGDSNFKDSLSFLGEPGLNYLLGEPMRSPGLNVDSQKLTEFIVMGRELAEPAIKTQEERVQEQVKKRDEEQESASEARRKRLQEIANERARQREQRSDTEYGGQRQLHTAAGAVRTPDSSWTSGASQSMRTLNHESAQRENSPAAKTHKLKENQAEGAQRRDERQSSLEEPTRHYQPPRERRSHRFRGPDDLAEVTHARTNSPSSSMTNPTNLERSGGEASAMDSTSEAPSGSEVGEDLSSTAGSTQGRSPSSSSSSNRELANALDSALGLNTGSEKIPEVVVVEGLQELAEKDLNIDVNQVDVIKLEVQVDERSRFVLEFEKIEERQYQILNIDGAPPLLVNSLDQNQRIKELLHQKTLTRIKEIVDHLKRSTSQEFMAP